MANDYYLRDYQDSNEYIDDLNTRESIVDRTVYDILLDPDDDNIPPSSPNYNTDITLTEITEIDNNTIDVIPLTEELAFPISPIYFQSSDDHQFSIIELNPTQSLNDITLVPLDSNTSLTAADSSFDFEVTVVDTVGDTSPEVLDLFRNLSELALATWGQHIGSLSGASLEVLVNVGGTTAVASAGPGSLFFTDFVDANGSGGFNSGDIGVVTAGSLLELQTGVDLNGAESDININVNPEFINDSSFFFDLELDDTVPEEAIDFFSVLLHELAHGLGFFGLTDGLPVADNLPFGDFLGFGNITVATLFDLLIDDSSSIPRFVGSNSVAAYGTGVPIESTTDDPGSDFAHFLGNTANDSGFPVDLRLALENPFVIRGDRVDIGALELALLEDIGHTIINADVPFINTLDTLPNSAVPVVTVGGLSDFDGSNISFALNLSSIVPFNTISSSVGIEVSTSAGADLSGRGLFLPGTLGADFTLSLADVFGVLDVQEGGSISASVDVRLFNPAQAVLENAEIGSVSESFTTLELTFDRGTNEEQEFFGGTSDDIFFGGNDEDEIFGNDGNDFLFGEGGDDELFGGNGNDVLTGGGGSDEFIFSSGNDIITDFNVEIDELELNNFDGVSSPTLTDTEDGLRVSFTDTDSIFLIGLSTNSFSELDDLFD